MVAVIYERGDMHDKGLKVKYERVPKQPGGIGDVHKSSRKIGHWQLDQTQTAFDVTVQPDHGSVTQQLWAGHHFTPEEAAGRDAAMVKLIEDLPQRASNLLKDVVITKAKRRRTIVVEDEQVHPTMGVHIIEQLQGRLSEVKEELQGSARTRRVLG